MEVQWIVAAIGIFLVGAGLGFFLAVMLRREDSSKLADAEAELASYKRDVTEHFGQSAQHFQAIGSHYRRLYEHMAAGSETLCDPVAADDRLKFPQPAEVAIEAPAVEAAATPEPTSDDQAGDEHSREDDEQDRQTQDAASSVDLKPESDEQTDTNRPKASA